MMNYKFLLTSIIFLIIFSFNVNAFAVTSYYWEDYPLILGPGETKEVRAFGLQNLVDGEDIIAQVSLGAGKEIAEVIDKSNLYAVPFGRKDVYINLRISIPEDAPLGKEYKVGASFSTLPANNEGKTVQLVSGIDSSIKVVVGKTAEEKVIVGAGEREIKQEIIEGKSFNTGNILLSLIVLIIIVVSVYYFWFRKKNE